MLAALAAPEGLDALAADDSLIPAPEVERARARRAEAGEAEAALRRISGILGVRVVRGPTAASAIITHAAGAPPATGAQVRRVVSQALGDLSPDAIEVVWSEASPPPPPAEAPRRPSALGVVLALACATLGGWVARRSVARR